MTLTVQWLTMAAMLLSGLGMGVVFDGYRVLSGELKFPRWWLPVLDVVYWMIAAAAVFRVLYASNNGEVRAYVFIGLACGVILYYFFLSKVVIAVVKWLIGAVRAFIAFVYKLIDIFIVKPLQFLYRIVKIFLGFGSALTIFLLKVVLQLVRPIWKLLLALLRPVYLPIGRWLAPRIAKLQLVERSQRLKAAITKWWSKWFRR